MNISVPSHKMAAPKLTGSSPVRLSLRARGISTAKHDQRLVIVLARAVTKRWSCLASETFISSFLPFGPHMLLNLMAYWWYGDSRIRVYKNDAGEEPIHIFDKHVSPGGTPRWVDMFHLSDDLMCSMHRRGNVITRTARAMLVWVLSILRISYQAVDLRRKHSSKILHLSAPMRLAYLCLE